MGKHSVRAQTRLFAVTVRCAALASLVCACTPYVPKPIDTRRSAADFSALRLDDARVREGVAHLLPRAAQEWPPHQWNRADLLAVALCTNRTLAEARAQVDVALAHTATASQTPNPDLTLQSEYARHDPHPWLYGLGLDITLRSPDRKHLEVAFAELDVANARGELLGQLWNVRHAIVDALSDLQSAQHLQATTRQLAAEEDRLIALEERRVAAGEDAADGLLLARQARLDITRADADASLSATAARGALAKALGVPLDALNNVEFAWPEWGNPPPDARDRRALREQALLARPDLAVAIGEYAKAENKLHQAVLRQYPQFQLAPGYYWDHGIAKFPFDVSFTLPLFNHNQGEIAETTAAREAAGAHMLALQAAIDTEIAAAEAAETTARGAAEAAGHQLDIVRTQRDHAAVNVRLGAGDAGDSSRAEILVLQAQIETVRMQERLQAARNATEDALHTPLSGPELELANAFSAAVAGADR